MIVNQTAAASTENMSLGAKIVQTIFTTALLVSIIAGTVLVAGQAIGLAMGSPDLITGMNTYVAPWAFGAAAVVCISSLLTSYFKIGVQEQDD